MINRKQENENEIGQEEFYFTVPYYEEKEEEEEGKGIRLNHGVYSTSTDNPIFTDRIAAEIEKSDAYIKWEAAIKALPNSHKRNTIMNEYLNMVEKYERLMEKMSGGEKEQKDPLGNNKHSKTNFEFYTAEWKEGQLLRDEFIFYLNDHFEHANIKFFELPIKYTIISCNLEIYWIWCDRSLITEINKCWKQFMEKHWTTSTKFSLNWLPNAVLMIPQFKKVKDFYFNDLVINIDTMKIEIKKEYQEGHQKICDIWNKVLGKNFKLKSSKYDLLQMNTVESYYLKNTSLSLPPDVNCFIIDNPRISRIKSPDNFSVFRHKITRTILYVIYNSEEELSDEEIIKFIDNYINPTDVLPVQKFSFKDTSEIKDFIEKYLSSWVFEIIGMDNKFLPSFIAKLNHLSNKKLDIKSNYKLPNSENSKNKPLILTDLEQMKLFTKLTEKTSMDDEPSKIMLSREWIPNFYKNLNVVYSCQIYKVMSKMFGEFDHNFNLFNNDFFGFHLDFIEPAEVYIAKNEKCQKILSKMLNNIDFKKMNTSIENNYTPSNGRTCSKHEREWFNVLVSNIDRTYWLANLISLYEFDIKLEEFRSYYRDKEGSKNNLYEFKEGIKLNESHIIPDFIGFVNNICGDFRFGKWFHWKQDLNNKPAEPYVTKRERFKLENPKAWEFVKNIGKINLRFFIFDEWRNRTIPKVFANMKKDLGFRNTQREMIDMFGPWKLEIDYKSFKDYFEDENIRDTFFGEEDYEYDDEKETIIIKNWFMIPILGILKMSDDYKNGWVKEGFEFEPYGTFTDPKNEKPYVQIQLDQIRKGECGKEFIGEPCSLADYEKIYELNNWHAHLTFNGVKYFYFVQDKQSSIVVKEVCVYIRFSIHKIYKFLHSSNPIDLITIAMKFSHQTLQQTIGIIEEEIKDVHLPTVFKAVYKQIYIEQDTLEYHLANLDYKDPPQLHFPALLPTYAFFNDTMKDYMENQYDNTIKLLTDRSFEKYMSSRGKKENDSDKASLLANPKFREYTAIRDKKEEKNKKSIKQMVKKEDC
jgi:hypothetical protein